MLPIIRVIDPPYGDKIKVRNPDERFKNTILLNFARLNYLSKLQYLKRRPVKKNNLKNLESKLTKDF